MGELDASYPEKGLHILRMELAYVSECLSLVYGFGFLQDAERESDDDSGGGGTGAPDDTADIIMIMELLNGLTTYLVADIHQSATRAAQKIAQFPSSAEAIGWFVTASLELRDDVDEDEMEEVVMILEPAMNSAPDAAFYNENNGIAEGRLGPVYDALFVLALNNAT